MKIQPNEPASRKHPQTPAGVRRQATSTVNTGRLYKANYRKLPVNICVSSFSTDHTLEHDHFPLIKRCLDSIVEKTNPEMYRLHIGCNNLSPRAMAYVDELVATHNAVKYIGEPVEDSEGKTVYPKYPLMRKIYRATAGRISTPEAADWIVWFDDDSHVTENDWLERLEETINASPNVHQLGSMNMALLPPEKVKWATQFPSFNPAIGIPTVKSGTDKETPGCKFITGGFYALSRYAIRICSIPDERLFHNDGDWSTGLFLMHKGLKIANFTYGVQIDDAPRRGMHLDKWVPLEHPAMTDKPWYQGEVTEVAADSPPPGALANPRSGHENHPAKRENSTTSIPEAYRIARTHYDAGRLEKAEKICRRIINTAPRHPRALHLLGLVHYKKGDYSKAEECLRQAVEGRPSLSHFHNDLGASISALGRHAEALTVYREAERLAEPGNIHQVKGVYRNIALALQRVGRIDDAMEYHTRMLELIPDDVETIWNRSHIYLAKGDFQRGWEGYEARLHLKSHQDVFKRHRATQKRWDGKPFPGKSLLIQNEQGLGDTIQFLRFAPLVKALGGTVILETRQPLLRLLSGSSGFDEIINRVEGKRREAEFDLDIPLMSLPGLLNIGIDNIPANVPYVHAEQDLVDKWKQRFSGAGLKVGLVWTGNLENLGLRHRSIELSDLAPFLDVPGVTLYSLQYGTGEDQLADLPQGISVHNLGEEVAPFEELAAATANLDLVITVDTAMAHLAGAMGRPVWMMLSYPPDWRWLLERDDSPWYPSMRLFRQEQSGKWGSVFLKLHKALEKFSTQHQTDR